MQLHLQRGGQVGFTEGLSMRVHDIKKETASRQLISPSALMAPQAIQTLPAKCSPATLQH